MEYSIGSALVLLSLLIAGTCATQEAIFPVRLSQGFIEGFRSSDSCPPAEVLTTTLNSTKVAIASTSTHASRIPY